VDDDNCPDGNRCAKLGSFSLNDGTIKYCSNLVEGYYFAGKIWFSNKQQKIYAIPQEWDGDDFWDVVIFSIDPLSCEVNIELTIPFKSNDNIIPGVYGAVLIEDILYIVVQTNISYFVSANLETRKYEIINILDTKDSVYTGKGTLLSYKDQFLIVRNWVYISMINPKTGQITDVQKIQVPSKFWPNFFNDIAIPDDNPYLDETAGLIYVRYVPVSDGVNTFFTIAGVNLETGVIETSPNIMIYDNIDNFLNTELTVIVPN